MFSRLSDDFTINFLFQCLFFTVLTKFGHIRTPPQPHYNIEHLLSLHISLLLKQFQSSIKNLSQDFLVDFRQFISMLLIQIIDILSDETSTAVEQVVPVFGSIRRLF